MEQAVEVPQPETPAVPPASPSDETSAKPEQETGPKGTGSDAENDETPQRRESRRQRQLNRLRERAAAAEAELRILREQQGRQQQPKDSPASDEPQREQFGSYEEFIEARASWRAEKVAEEKTRKIIEESRTKDERERVSAEREEVTKTWNTQVEKARDEIEDFDEVCAESESIVTAHMSQAILESEQGALIAYHLAKNPAEAERISKLSPSKQAAAIVTLEEKVAKVAKKSSNAPNPITPVGTRANAIKDPSRLSDSEWYYQRKSQG